MIEIKPHRFQHSQRGFQRRLDWQDLARSVCAYSLLGVLLLVVPLTTAAQGKRVARLPGPTVNSTPLKVYGPFRAGIKVVKSEFDEVAEHEEDYSVPPGNDAVPRTAPTIRPAGSNGVTRIATIEQAGPSAVAALKNAPDQIKARDLEFGESFLSIPSPTPTYVWATGASANDGNVDPQLAVSSTAVGVLTWDKLAFYDKSGALLPSTPTFDNPTNLKTLFAKVVAEMDQKLNLNVLTGNSSVFKMASGQVGDARLQFDVFRRRWVIAGTAKNNSKAIKFFPQFVQLSQRRTKIILAVSRDEDPAKGFNTFFFDGSPDDGACSSISDSEPCPGTSFTPGNAADYPSLGVSPRHYLITVHVDHEDVDGSGGHPLWGYLVAVNAQDAADGLEPRANAFKGWPIGGGDKAKGVTMPVVEHNPLPLIGSGLIASTNNGQLVISFVSPNDPPTLGSIAFDISDMESPAEWLQKGSVFQLIEYGNVRTQPITAHLVGSKLIVAFNDCRKWINEQSDCSPSIHLVVADLSHLPLIHIDHERVFGWRNKIDDDPNDVVAYGMPGAVTNADGDLVVVYSRTSPRLYPEVRYSAWMHGEFDLRPSQRLRAGDAPIALNPSDCLSPGSEKCKPTLIDTAGVALDPFDKTAIWIAHLFANSSGKMRVMVGKVLGKRHPDLSVSGVSLTSKPVRAGSPLTIGYTIANGGDGVALEPRVKVILIPARGVAQTVLGEDTPTYLSPGESRTNSFKVTVPANLRLGRYRVLVQGRLVAGETEYSTRNNFARSALKVIAPWP